MGDCELDNLPVNETFKGGEQETPPKDDGELLRSLCPKYLAMGMTLTEYWEGDAEWPRYVREAYKLKQQKDNENRWLQGLYVYDAMIRVSPIYHDFIKNPQVEPYPSEPYKIFPEKKEKITEDKHNLDIQDKVRAWAEKVNRLMGEKKDGK